MDRILQTKEAFALHTVDGLRPENITFRNLTMESDAYVLVRDQQPNGGPVSLVIVDCFRRVSERHAISQAESAIMKPNSRILALQMGVQMQAFNIDTRERIMSANMPEAIEFWKWLDDDICVIVTATAVYHWLLNNEGKTPQKVFDRVLDSNTRILNYYKDEKSTWFMLCGCLMGPNGLDGKTQLYSVERGASLTLSGFAGAFTLMPTPKDAGQCNILCLASNNTFLFKELPTGTKMDRSCMIEVTVPLQMTASNDFPVAVHITPHKLCMMCTSQGNLFIFDIITGALVAQERVSNSTVFCGTTHKMTGGMQLVNSSGSVFVVGINNNALIPYLKNYMGNMDLALRVASASGLSGVDDLFQAQFVDLVRQGEVIGAVDCCARAPHNLLRTPQTLNQLRNMSVSPGSPIPLSAYFKAMMDIGKLNEYESIELSRTVVEKSGNTDYIKVQMDADKFTLSVALGELVETYDSDLALKIYAKCENHSQIMKIFLARGEVMKAVEYCKRVNYSPDWRLELQKLIRSNSNEAVTLALALHRDMGPQPILDPLEVIDMFVSQQQVRSATQLLMEILSGGAGASLSSNSAVDAGKLQTCLFEINLKHSPPSVAEKIFNRNMYSNYNGMVLAPLCERAGLYQRAIECYIEAQYQNSDLDNLANVRNCLKVAESFNGEWLIDFFGKLGKDDSLLCFEDLLENYQRHFNVLVAVAIKYHEALGVDTLINMFLEKKLYDVIFAFLGPIVPFTREPEVHFHYIEAALEVGNIDEVERMTRESPCYDAERTKAIVKSKKLTNLWPFINICDKHNFIEEMVYYLMDTNHKDLVEQYVQRRNPMKTPHVIGALLDINSDEDYIIQVLNASGAMCPVDDLVMEVEKRGQMRLLLPWLEMRKNERKTDPAIHNALGKIYVDENNNVEDFLKNNEYYDPLVLGEYCKGRNTHYAFICFNKANADDKVLHMTVKNGMWKELARYLVHRQDSQLWERALQMDLSDRDHLVEAIQQTALPESKVVEEVIVTVKAFLSAGMNKDLTAILDQVVLHGEFRNNRHLENLLIISATHARPDKVMEYVNNLDNYDSEDIANIALTAGLNEVAFTIYDKKGMKKRALETLLNELNDLPRGRAYAQKIDEAPCWSVFGAHLFKKGELHEAVEALIKANNPNYVQEVFDACESANQYDDMIKYLLMARTETKNKNPLIATLLVFTYAKTGRIQEFEKFLKDAQGIQLLNVADKLFSEGLYDSASILYQMGNNFNKLALTLIKMNNLPEAVVAAEKAKNFNTWKELNVACLVAENFDLARLCALHLVTRSELLTETIKVYEDACYWKEIINVLKSATAQNGAHMGLFTELAILYAKYNPEKLIDHLNLFPKKINVHRIMGVCEKYHHWLALSVLYRNNEDWLAAANIIMKHPAACWDHEFFKNIVHHLGSSDVIYTGINFYIQYHPDCLLNYLQHIAKRLDPTRVLMLIGKGGVDLVIIQSFLESIQERNIKRVNETLNDMYVNGADYVSLRKSVGNFDNFDCNELANQLEKSELFEFRKIALTLQRKNKRYAYAIALAKENQLYQEAIDTAAVSRDATISESLLDYFLENNLQEYFVSTLYTCYEYIRPHVVLEKAWRHKCMDAVMPYMIQQMQQLTSKVDHLEKTIEEAKAAAVAGAGGGASQETGRGRQPLMIQQGSTEGGGDGYSQGRF